VATGQTQRAVALLLATEFVAAGRIATGCSARISVRVWPSSVTAIPQQPQRDRGAICRDLPQVPRRWRRSTDAGSAISAAWTRVSRLSVVEHLGTLQTSAQSGTGSVLLQVAPILLSVLGVLVATLSLSFSLRANNRARQASLSWSIYQEYAQPRIRSARGAVQLLACSPDCPTDGEEYLRRVADGSPWENNDGDSVDAEVRRLLRFYNQLSVLLGQRLIDDDFLFTLIGPGLKTAWPTLEPALEYYEFYYLRDGRVAWQTAPRLIYNGVPVLYERCARWTARQRPAGRTMRAVGTTPEDGPAGISGD
jgi:hypothetical protein